MQAAANLLPAVLVRLARVEETAAQVLQAVARLEQRVQHQQQPQQQEQQQQQQQQQQPVTGTPGNTAAGPTSLQIDPSALASLLAALDRVEQQEQEIRDRWFGSGDGGGGGGSGTADGSRGDIQASAVVNTDNYSDQVRDMGAGLCGSAKCPDFSTKSSCVCKKTRCSS